MKYGTIPHTFWQDDRIADPMLRLMYCYLASSPHRNMLSLYRLPLAYAAADLNISQQDAKALLEGLSKAELCQYDHGTSMVWLTDATHRDFRGGIKPSDLRLKNIPKVLAELPSEHPFVVELVKEYNLDHLLAELRKGARKAGSEKGASKGASKGGSKQVTVTVPVAVSADRNNGAYAPLTGAAEQTTDVHEFGKPAGGRS